jgi:hypothetical protein
MKKIRLSAVGQPRQVQDGDVIVILEAKNREGGNAYAGWTGTVEDSDIEGFVVRRKSGGSLICSGRGPWGVGRDTLYALVVNDTIRFPYQHSYDELRAKVKQERKEDSLWQKFKDLF